MGGCAERATFEANTIRDDRAQMVIEYLKQQEEDRNRKKSSKKFRKTFNALTSHDSESEYLETRKTHVQEPLLLHPLENLAKSRNSLNSPNSPKNSVPSQNPSQKIFGGKSLVMGKGLLSKLTSNSAVDEEKQKKILSHQAEDNIKKEETKKIVFSEEEKMSIDQPNNVFSSNSESIILKKQDAQDSLEIEKSPIGIKLNLLKSDEFIEDFSKAKNKNETDLRNESSQTFKNIQFESPKFINVEKTKKPSFESLELEKQAFGVTVSPMKSIDLKITKGSSEQILPARVSISADIVSINHHDPLKVYFYKSVKMPEINYLACLEPEKPVFIQKEVVIVGNAKRPLSPRIDNKRPKYKRLHVSAILKNNETVVGKPPGLVEGKNPFSIAGSFVEENLTERKELERISENIELQGKDAPRANSEKNNKIPGFGLGIIHDSVLGEYYEESEMKSSEIDKNEKRISVEKMSKSSSRKQKKLKKKSSSEIEEVIHVSQYSEVYEPENKEEVIEIQDIDLQSFSSPFFNAKNTEVKDPEYKDDMVEANKVNLPDYNSPYLVSENLPISKKSGLKKSNKKALRSHNPDPKSVQFSEAPDDIQIEDIEVENVILSNAEMPSELLSQKPNDEKFPVSKKFSLRENLIVTPDNLISTPELDIFNIGSQVININPESVQLPVIEASRRSLSPNYIVQHNRVGGSDDDQNYHRESSFEQPIRAESPNFQNNSLSSSLMDSFPNINVFKQEKNIDYLSPRGSINIPDLRASLNNSGIFFKNSRMHLLRKSPRKLSPELFKKNLQGKLTADEEIKHSYGQ